MTCARLATSKADSTKCCGGYGEYILGENGKTTWEKAWQFLIQVNMC